LEHFERIYMHLNQF